MMLYPVKHEAGAYDPETIAIIAVAFDAVCQSLAARMNGNSDDFRWKAASTILRRVDRGERDPTQLAAAARRELVERNCPIPG